MSLDRHGRTSANVEGRGKKPCATLSYRFPVAVFDSEARLSLRSSRFGDRSSLRGSDKKKSQEKMRGA